MRAYWCSSLFDGTSTSRSLASETYVAEAVRYYAPHSFSVQTSKEKLTLAKHVHAIGQLVSHSRPLLGQLVHVNFLAPVSYRVLGRRACGYHGPLPPVRVTFTGLSPMHADNNPPHQSNCPSL